MTVNLKDLKAVLGLCENLGAQASGGPGGRLGRLEWCGQREAGKAVEVRGRQAGAGLNSATPRPNPPPASMPPPQVRLWFDGPGNPLVAEPHFPHAQGQVGRASWSTALGRPVARSLPHACAMPLLNP